MSACDLRPPEQQLITASARSSALEAKDDFAERSLYKTEKSIHISSEMLRGIGGFSTASRGVYYALGKAR